MSPMVVPEWFEAQLALEHDGRFTARWSNARSCVVLDERVARGVAITPYRLARKLDVLRRLGKSDQADEYLYRLRHGTQPYAEVFSGNRAPCPACGARVELQPQTWAFAHCGLCGKDFPAVFYSLGPALLEELRYRSLAHGAEERLIADMDRANDANTAAQEGDARAALDASVRDDWAQIIGIPRSSQTRADYAAIADFQARQETPA